MDSSAPSPRPRFPEGTCDCHAHLFGPFDRYPLPAEPSYKPEPATWPSYLSLLRSLGCSRAVLVQPSPYGVDHSALLGALKSKEFPLRAIALIDGKTTDKELEALHYAGFVGVRQHILPKTKDEVLPGLAALAQRVKRFGWHLQIYMDAGKIPDLDRHLDALAVPVVIDHFALIPASQGVNSDGFKSLLRLAKGGRCWFKLSAPYRISSNGPAFDDVAPMARALVEAAPDQCVWGSDWPHPNATHVPDDHALIDILAKWIPDESARRKILIENPAKLYSF